MSEGMNIIVCIKQVPETMEVDFDKELGRLKREGVASVVNPFDEYAIEEGIRLKEKFGGTVRVLSMGPPQAESALRSAIAMGADEAYLATDMAFAGADTWATSYTLGLSIECMAPYDLVICGLKTIDGDTGQVGPELAHCLGIPHVCYVNEILKIDGGNIRLKRVLDDRIEILGASLPIVVSVSKSINQPRLATLRGRLKAKKAEIQILTSNDLEADPLKLGLKGSPTRVTKISTPARLTAGKIVDGSPEELAKSVFQKLVEYKVI
ncbi:MAG: electron transfer flavoprotein subunit beta/FixA family protein [Candidatus Bathyarchaeota archaeon]|jgi:electron transfer flavoprotein beta subunit|nr:electron transfer flavoprotein subunit beta/FixA family protein [Candidatus Bathyarchaeota archaeon]MDP7207173.1 electron transfer flavoprotein subunit beta/FixA family protein [Candidatus Bathyarchaeota archaeon]MDP7443256.1 electron transfer flavoprotein subunit beta/FixA family protein [Candidatus Bathyarchaeota archaeon]|tara:strand:+ start:4818 stop:5615 length:798 start_codon:yes stop_codon:yes gene_type:complete